MSYERCLIVVIPVGTEFKVGLILQSRAKQPKVDVRALSSRLYVHVGERGPAQSFTQPRA